ncbi:heme A synthase [Candidatus Marinamargulisbacteria bacterium SCGC AG-343-D04]|nr:heme A synthase [Candidatus Marinamargulisbacteria bacterium SCGC AG-343-D04]
MITKRQLTIWYGLVSILILVIICVGAITRLTNSGLSMVEWRPIFGFLPPLSLDDWNVVFNQYKLFPEYQKLNAGMSLIAFKKIFFWEYFHRVLGRLIGISLIFPFIYFLFRKKLSPSLIRKTLIMIVLVVFQGFLGWYMVKSGLVENPKVNHIRLWLHLSGALLLLEYILWTLLKLHFPIDKRKKWNKLILFWTFLLCVQISYGAFVAGLDAGWIYNSYPKMNNEWIPSSILLMDSFLTNIVHNPVMVQFVHRHLALIILGIFCSITWRLKQKSSVYCDLAYVILLLLSAQVLLGILTLVLSVPISLAVLHQFLAVMLLSFSVSLSYLVRED